jgi:energy-coupling factor transporter ATP-binding protein EcfA2
MEQEILQLPQMEELPQISNIDKPLRIKKQSYIWALPEIEDDNGKVIAPYRKFFIDNKVALTLIRKRELVTKKNRDQFFVFTGPEGSGKSTLAFQFARFINPSTTLANVCLDPEEFPKLIGSLGKGECAVLDEAFSGLASTRAQSRINHLLKSIFMEARQRNLFIFIILPSMFYLDKYILLERASVLFHTYFKKDVRGRYAIYNKGQIKKLELFGRKSRNMNVCRPFHRTRFSPTFVFDAENEDKNFIAYNKMKRDSFLGKVNQEKKTMRGPGLNYTQEQNAFEQRDKAIYEMRNRMEIPVKEIARIFGISIDIVYESYRKYLITKQIQEKVDKLYKGMEESSVSVTA